MVVRSDGCDFIGWLLKDIELLLLYRCVLVLRVGVMLFCGVFLCKMCYFCVY